MAKGKSRDKGGSAQHLKPVWLMAYSQWIDLNTLLSTKSQFTQILLGLTLCPFFCSRILSQTPRYIQSSRFPTLLSAVPQASPVFHVLGSFGGDL